MTALAFLLLGFCSLTLAQLKPGQNAWLGSARGLINPSNGTAQVVGYFSFIEGVPGPFFSGNPSEATAFFTFRSTTLSLTPPIANGPNLSITMFSPGTFSVYFNASPHGDFSNLDSFSSGELIATFQRSLGMIVANAGSTGSATFSAKLVSTQNFVVGGRTLSFGNLVPHGVTTLITTSNVFVPGPSEFPVAQPFAFSAIALGGGGSNDDSQ